MYKLVLILMLLGIVLACLCAATSTAAFRSKDDRLALVERFDGEVKRLRAAMEGLEYSPAQLEEYLYNAAWLVYEGKVCAHDGLGPDVEATNDDLTALTGLGLVADWPGNPLNNWEPMRVLKPGDGFSAGDLCLSVCPSSHGTTLAKRLRCCSFSLYVFGPTETCRGFDLDRYPGDMREWDTPPAGALYKLPFWVMSDKKREEGIRRWTASGRKLGREKKE